jgi:hypothetical protein
LGYKINETDILMDAGYSYDEQSKRITCIFYVLIFLLLPVFKSNAQNYAISINADRKALSEIINELTSTYKLQFAYSSNQVNLDQKVSVDVKNVSLETALKRILHNTGVTYSINGSQVVLFKDPNQRFSISGRVREKGTGELLIGVIINTMPPKAGAMSNGYGFYSITLPADTYSIQFNYIGFKPLTKKLEVNQSIDLDVELEPASNLNEVVISDNAIEKQYSLNTIEVPLKEISSVPMILGEKDVLKYIMLMPGLQKGNEGNSYMYVRGGGPDQNLILMDDAVIYNAYHYLGLSSLFTGTELKNAELIKGGFSSKYGGRLSSVLNMSLKDGNREHYGAEATLGVISSKVMVEGPIVKNKSSFLISARKSYIDKVSKILAKSEEFQLNYSYYDLHAKVSTDIGTKDRLMLSGYLGNDLLENSTDPNVNSDDDGIKWGNKAATMRWNHQYSGRLFSNTSLVYSYYRSRLAFGSYTPESGLSSSAVQSTINDYTVKYDLDYLPSGFRRIKTGVGLTRHNFSPLTSYKQTFPEVSDVRKDAYYANEGFAYGEYSFLFTSGLNIIPGVRFSYYDNQKSYFRAEPRLNIIYKLKKDWSVNATYDMMNQYVHLISSFSGFGFPSDIWTSSDAALKPQRAQVISAGIYKSNIKQTKISFAIEGYYKRITDMAMMRDGASFFQLLSVRSGTNQVQVPVENWNDLLTSGTCTSYGTEVQLKKEGTHFSGWISYTLSKTMIEAKEVNNGNTFPATYDRRHDLGIYLSYKTARHFSFSTNWVYGTGNAISFPVGRYFMVEHDPVYGPQGTSMVSDYEKKNSYRMKPYHRPDLSVQYQHLMGRRILSTIELSIYNAYNRANPFFYQISSESSESGAQKNTVKQVSLFPIMPSLSWTIKF